jgi:aminoglycoside/choline kinase family phosphotransferase
MDRTLNEDELLKITHDTLAHWPSVSRCEAILKGGSDRRFYRLHFEDGAREPMILMSYTMARPDNPRFVAATHRLEKLGVHAPKIYAHDDVNLLIWLEDLGSVDLFAFRDESWSLREAMYQATLTEVAKLHAVDAAALTDEDIAEMELCFDERLYEWEQNYFLTHFVRGFLKRDTDKPEFAIAHEALRGLRQHLSTLPRGLVHRDFQSQNVIIRDGAAWLIDYQGVRPGLPEYDLASLLLDPYVNLAEGERDALLEWYAAHTGKDLAALQETYQLCAAQRLMQALGAYANLSMNLGKTHFQDHIPVALERLRDVCGAHPMLGAIASFVAGQ